MNELGKIIRKIVDTQGIGVLSDCRRFNAFLDDLGPELVLERKIFRRAVSNEVLTLFIPIMEKTCENTEFELLNIKRKLHEEFGVAESWCLILVNGFASAVGVDFIEESSTTSIKNEKENNATNDFYLIPQNVDTPKTTVTQPKVTKNNYDRPIKNNNEVAKKVSNGWLVITIKDSLSPLAMANGTTYAFTVDQTDKIYMKSERFKSINRTEIACGKHNIGLKVYGYGDSSRVNPLYTISPQSFEIKEGKETHLFVTRGGFLKKPQMNVKYT